VSAGTPPPDVLTGLVPLVRFTGERRKMGEFANGRLLSAAAWSVAAVIVGLNGWLLVGTFRQWTA
jgi:manganese transport protein